MVSCQKTPAAKNEKSKCKQTIDILDEALQLDFICTCKQKPLCSDKLLKCHNPFCQSGKFFHLPCLNVKRVPNNAITTWECMVCKSGEKTEQSSSFTSNLCGFPNGVFIRIRLTRRGSSPLTKTFTSQQVFWGGLCVCGW